MRCSACRVEVEVRNVLGVCRRCVGAAVPYGDEGMTSLFDVDYDALDEIFEMKERE